MLKNAALLWTARQKQNGGGSGLWDVGQPQAEDTVIIKYLHVVSRPQGPVCMRTIICLKS